MDVTTFRTDFPEFANATTYPDATVNFYIGLATAMVNPDVWVDQADYGIALFVAHHLVLATRESKAAAVGQIPGKSIQGITASKSVDKVSVSYDASSVRYEGAGFWNATSYGIQFFRLIRIFGAGGVQL